MSRRARPKSMPPEGAADGAGADHAARWRRALDGVRGTCPSGSRSMIRTGRPCPEHGVAHLLEVLAVDAGLAALPRRHASADSGQEGHEEEQAEERAPEAPPMARTRSSWPLDMRLAVVVADDLGGRQRPITSCCSSASLGGRSGQPSTSFSKPSTITSLIRTPPRFCCVLSQVTSVGSAAPTTSRRRRGQPMPRRRQAGRSPAGSSGEEADGADERAPVGERQVHRLARLGQHEGARPQTP